MWQRWLWLFVLLLLHLAQSDARVQPLKHRRAKSVAASRGLKNGAGTGSVGASGAQGLRKNSGLKARRRRAHNTVGGRISDIPQERRRRRRAGEKLALQAGEESGDAAPVVKGTKKKKKKAGGKKKMSKEEAIAAAQEAQAAAAAALEKGISHEDAAKAAEAALKEKGATELTKGVLGAEDVEKAEGRPAPFKKKEEGSKDAAATEAGVAAADAAAAPAKKKKKKKKAAAAASGTDIEKVEEASKGNAAVAADSSDAEAESKASAEAKAAAEATDPPKPVTKKKKKKKKKVATGEVSDRSLRTLDHGAPMLRQQGDVIVDDLDKEMDDEDADYEVDDEDIEDEAEEEEFELEMTGSAETEEAVQFEAGPKQHAPPVTTPAAPNAPLPERSADSAANQKSSDLAGGSPQSAGLASAVAAQPSPQLAAAAPGAAGEAASGAAAGPPMAATDPPGVAAGAPAQPPAKPARPWFPLPEKREISTEVLSSLINASAAAVKRDAAAFGSKLRKHVGLQQPDAAAEDSAPHHHHGETMAEKEGKHAKREEGKEEGIGEPVHQKDAPAMDVEAPALPEVKQLPPWFKDTPDNKDVVKVGSGQRHKSRQKALGAEDKWLRAHQRHLAEVREEHDVIFYGDDLIEAWRGTFVGQKYGPFNDVPAVWDQFFGTKGYKALAAGIAGDGVEHLLWRLRNGELPPIVPPKAIIVACGTNSKGLSGECALPAAEEAAAAMRELLEFVREALPATRIVALAPLPKGDYWPNRCTPAFDLFNANLRAVAGEHPGHVHVEDYGAAFLTSRASNVWASNSTVAVRQEINEMFMPDALHPSAAGMRLIAGKLEPLVSRLVSEAEAAGAQSA
ncbi:g3501 [Coccomyxa elongata]